MRVTCVAVALLVLFGIDGSGATSTSRSSASYWVHFQSREEPKNYFACVDSAGIFTYIDYTSSHSVQSASSGQIEALRSHQIRAGLHYYVDTHAGVGESRSDGLAAELDVVVIGLKFDGDVVVRPYGIPTADGVLDSLIARLLTAVEEAESQSMPGPSLWIRAQAARVRNQSQLKGVVTLSTAELRGMPSLFHAVDSPGELVQIPAECQERILGVFDGRRRFYMYTDGNYHTVDLYRYDPHSQK